MSFDWTEYLSLAETLGGLHVSGPIVSIEAQQRSSVSRAYYAAFILARNRLRDVDRVPIPQTGAAHIFVAQQYGNHPDPVRQQIGTLLTRLRGARNTCDYDDVVTDLSGLSRRAVRRAARVIADLARL
jgi:uncharacterized protein (UPF0332 family)